MKNLVAQLVIALVVLSGIPALGLANTSPLIETIIENSNVGDWSLEGQSSRTHRIRVNRGDADIILQGDGSSDLDMFVYDSDGLVAKDECTCSYGKISLNITSSGFIRVKVMNRGDYYSSYSLTVR